MKTEIEAKFLSADHGEVRNKLKELGATLERPMRLMRRMIIDYPDRRLEIQKNAYIRVRDEGEGNIKLTYKQFDSLSIDGAKEIELDVSSFELTIALFENIGLEAKSFQESKREEWKLDGVEVVLDEWPWLDPYIEIEGGSEEDIRSVAVRLGFDWKNAIFGDVMVAYRTQFPSITKEQSISSMKRVEFSADPPFNYRKQDHV